MENTPQFAKKLGNSKESGLERNSSIGNLVSKFNESESNNNKHASRDSIGGSSTPRLLKRSDKISQLRESLLCGSKGSVESKYFRQWD